MSRPQSLTLQDIRAVFHLLGEIRELSSDMVAWRRHMAGGVSKLIHARVAITYEMPRILPGEEEVVHVGVVDVGWHSESEKRHFVRYVAGGYSTAPYIGAARKLLSQSRNWVRSREQWVDDRRWYGSVHFNEARRGARVDDFIYSHVSIPSADAFHGIGFHRSSGDERFRARERRQVALFHEELAQLWLGPNDAEPFASLPRRMRETLEFLLIGDSEKQVASKLDIAQNTVHRYVGMLHQHFGVHSRGELLAYCQGLLQQTRCRPRLYLQRRN
jgi:DNA-binding CsgD family transcriptional regulator